MSLNEIEQLLYRYTCGECTPQECAMIEKWLEENNSSVDEWQSLSAGSQKIWLNQVFDDILRETREPKVKEPIHWISRLSIGYAAATVLLLLAGVLFWQSWFKKPAAATAFVIKTEAGHRKQFILSDGTQVWLQGGSTLSYPKQFTTSRTVKLIGEAFFEVKHNATQPFIVATPHLLTTVLGTSFNVSAYPESSESGVFLEEGAVRVHIAGKESEAVLLAPQQVVWYQKKTGQLSRNTLEMGLTGQSFKTGNLIFNQTPLNEVLYRISKAYGVHFKYDERVVANCKLTGSFSSKQPIDELLKTLSISLSATYKRTGKEVLFSSRGC